MVESLSAKDSEPVCIALAEILSNTMFDTVAVIVTSADPSKDIPPDKIPPPRLMVLGDSRVDAVLALPDSAPSKFVEYKVLAL